MAKPDFEEKRMDAVFHGGGRGLVGSNPTYRFLFLERTRVCFGPRVFLLKGEKLWLGVVDWKADSKIVFAMR